MSTVLHSIWHHADCMTEAMSLLVDCKRVVRHNCQAAKMFNEIWRTGDPSSAKDIMADDVVIVSICMRHCVLQTVGWYSAPAMHLLCYV
jgi:hypothetical protein